MKRSDSTQTAPRGIAARLTPRPSTQRAHAAAAPAAALRSLRQSTFLRFADEVAGSENVLCGALREAEALAWQTGIPQLLFPELAEEKARAVLAWHQRQRQLRAPNWPIALAE